MQNRQKEEIVRDILTVCNGGSAITNIMFHAYLSHAQAKSYLRELIEKGLVEPDIFDKKYFTTSKGIDYVAALEGMMEMLAVGTRRTVRNLNTALPSSGNLRALRHYSCNSIK